MPKDFILYALFGGHFFSSNILRIINPALPQADKRFRIEEERP